MCASPGRGDGVSGAGSDKIGLFSPGAGRAPASAVRALTAIPVSVLLFVSVGCSSSKSEPSAAEAATAAASDGAHVLTGAGGTRLRATFLSGGGARELVGFHDMERNEDCTFQAADPGHTRCLPASLVAGQSGSFSDAACTIPTATVTTGTTAATPCSADAKYGITYRYDGSCGASATELRKVLDAKGPLYSGGPGSCQVQQGTPPPSAPAQVLLGEIVPWTAFVEATETVIEGVPVSEKVLVATDGARQHLSFQDTTRHADCTFQLMGDGVTRCLPEAPTGPVYYSDAECAKPALVNYYPGSMPCAKSTETNLWIASSLETCGGRRAVYSLIDYTGPGPDGNSEIYQYSNNSGPGPSATPATCSSAGSIGPGSSTGRYAINRDVTASFPATTRVSGAGSRLVPALVWPASGETLTPGWHDTERDVDCTFAVATDGKMRCLPVASTAALFFTDGSCKSPTLTAALNQPSCIGGRRFALVPSTTCPQTTTVYSLGTNVRALGPASAETSPGRCVQVAGVSSVVDATLMDPTQFVEGVSATE